MQNDLLASLWLFKDSFLQNLSILIPNEKTRNVHAGSLPIISHDNPINVFILLVVNDDQHHSSESLCMLRLQHEVTLPSINHDYRLVTVILGMQLRDGRIELIIFERQASIRIVNRIVKQSHD